jgi:hypothetical protein
MRYEEEHYQNRPVKKLKVCTYSVRVLSCFPRFPGRACTTFEERKKGETNAPTLQVEVSAYEPQTQSRDPYSSYPYCETNTPGTSVQDTPEGLAAVPELFQGSHGLCSLLCVLCSLSLLLLSVICDLLCALCVRSSRSLLIMNYAHISALAAVSSHLSSLNSLLCGLFSPLISPLPQVVASASPPSLISSLRVRWTTRLRRRATKRLDAPRCVSARAWPLRCASLLRGMAWY